jgi:hypothetical protein
MLSSLRINTYFLHMLHRCLTWVFYIVLMICHHFLTSSNLDLCILDVDQLCPFPRLTRHLKLLQQLLLRLKWHSREIRSILPCFLSLVLDDLPGYHILLSDMVIKTLLFILLCRLFPFLHAFQRLLNMSVGKKRWMRNIRLSRTIIHGMWFLAHQLLKPLVVNAFSQLSSALMGLWTGIRHI